MIVPYQNLKLLHKPITNKFLSSLARNINNSSFILGRDLKKFEKEFANYCGSKFAIGVSNGSDALFLALKVLNIKKGSEIILPAMTYISAAYSILQNNYKIVLCDINYQTGLMDINYLKKLINKKTKCIISTDLNGNVVALKDIKKLIKNKKIFIINDSSHSHGSLDSDGKKSGHGADLACFSLYPGKNLGALGDAGIITTNNSNFYKNLIKLRNFGSRKKFFHDIQGYNFKLDNIQASFLSLKLKLLDKWNKKKSLTAKIYKSRIKNNKIFFVENTQGSSYYAFVIFTKNRSRLVKYLENLKIQTNIYYPFSINQHKSLKKFFLKQKFPNAENYAKTSLAIPICPSLTSKQINHIVRSLNTYK